MVFEFQGSFLVRILAREYFTVCRGSSLNRDSRRRRLVMVYIFTLLWFRNMICILFIFICFLMIVRYQVVSFENLVVQGVLMFILFSLQESVGALLQNLNIWFKRLLRGVVFFCWMQKQLGEQIQLIDIFIRFFLDTFINFRLLILEMVDFFWVLFVYVYIIYYILVYVKKLLFYMFFFYLFFIDSGKVQDRIENLYL